MTIFETNPLSYLAHEIKVEDERAGRTFHLNWEPADLSMAGLETTICLFKQEVWNIYITLIDRISLIFINQNKSL